MCFLCNDFINSNIYGDLSVGDILVGNSGNDFLSGTDQESNNIYGGEGDDTIYGSSDNDSVYGEEGDDRLHASGYIDGGDGNDGIYGSNNNDLIFGQTGNDTIVGFTGDDDIYGGEGDDLIDGGAGRDFLLGGDGADTFILRSGDGEDEIFDFQDGLDKFLLADDLTYDDLTIIAEPGAVFSNYIIKINDTNETLIKVTQSFISGEITLNADDFTTIESQEESELEVQNQEEVLLGSSSLILNLQGSQLDFDDEQIFRGERPEYEPNEYEGILMRKKGRTWFFDFTGSEGGQRMSGRLISNTPFYDLDTRKWDANDFVSLDPSGQILDFDVRVGKGLDILRFKTFNNSSLILDLDNGETINLYAGTNMAAIN